MVTQRRAVTEYVTTQVAVSVPEQVPVTVMTTQQRQVPRQVAVTRCVMVPVTCPAAQSPAAIGAPRRRPNSWSNVNDRRKKKGRESFTKRLPPLFYIPIPFFRP